MAEPKPKRKAEITDYKHPKTAVGGSGASGGGGSINKVLKLVEQLAPAERDELLEQLKMENLRIYQSGIHRSRGEFLNEMLEL